MKLKNEVLLAVAITLVIAVASAFSVSMYIYTNNYHTISTKGDAIVTEENGQTIAIARTFLIDTYPYKGTTTTEIDHTFNSSSAYDAIRWALDNEHNVTIEAGNYSLYRTVIYTKTNNLTISPQAKFSGTRYPFGTLYEP